MNSWKKTLAIIWTGQAFSLLTTSIVQFAIIWWITKHTGKAESLAMATIAGILPQIFLGPFIGVLIDRWNRKKIMIISDLSIAFFTLIIGILFYFNVVNLWHIYVLLAIRSVGSAFHYPAMQASMPLLAPESQLTRIASINQTLYSISVIAGPALGALFSTISPMHFIVLLDVLGAILACTALAFVKIPATPLVEQYGKVWPELRASLVVIKNNKGLLALLIAWLVAVFFFVPVDSLFPLMTFDYFKGGAFEIGAVEIAFGAGMLISGGVMSIWSTNKRRVTRINLGLIIMGFTYFGAGLLAPSQYIIFVGLIFIMGVTVPIFNSPITSLMQSHIEPGMLGRVFSLIDTLLLLPVPFGLFFVGRISDTIGVNRIFSIAGVAIILVGIICFFIPPLMKLDKDKDVDNN